MDPEDKPLFMLLWSVLAFGLIGGVLMYAVIAWQGP
jgi:hypothetical protein